MSFLKNTTRCLSLVMRLNETDSRDISGNLTPGVVSAIIVAIGIVSIFLAKLFMFTRYALYGKTGLDTDFDAGGRVSAGLTATTIVSQWTWAATLLQSTTVTAKYGISGPFWYAVGASIQILLFAIISVQMKIHAPGAKTFLQVIRARFGKCTHIVFCMFALFTNILVTAILMLGGAAVLIHLAPDLSVELCSMLVAVVIGSYTFLGGLGATFYVSYFNTATMFLIMVLFIFKVYHEPNNPSNPLGSTKEMFDLLMCVEAPKGNLDNSFLTMNSKPAAMFGVITIVGGFGTLVADQSFWQSSVAAKPVQGVWGFLIGGLVWFAMPFTFATTMGLAYLAMSAAQGDAILTPHQVNQGLVVPVVAQRILGVPGQALIALMVLMAILSTGSAEVIAVTSILVYDIYMLYFKPFNKEDLDVTACILCRKERTSSNNHDDRCTCISLKNCDTCRQDDQKRNDVSEPIPTAFTCKMHGKYRTYEEYLRSLKNWGLLFTTASIIPLTLILRALQVSLGWVYIFMGVLIGSVVVPCILSMFWSRLNSYGMITGAIGGAATGITTWLGVASIQHGGLENFFESTGAEISMLSGNVASIVSGGMISVIVSALTNHSHKTTDCSAVWEKTRNIDSPLQPWSELYHREFNSGHDGYFFHRPSLQVMVDKFRRTRLVAVVGASCLTLLFVVIWPAVGYSLGVFEYSTFLHWLYVSKAWGLIATAVIVILPVISEYLDVIRGRKERLITIANDHQNAIEDIVLKRIENDTTII